MGGGYAEYTGGVTRSTRGELWGVHVGGGVMQRARGGSYAENTGELCGVRGGGGGYAEYTEGVMLSTRVGGMQSTLGRVIRSTRLGYATRWRGLSGLHGGPLLRIIVCLIFFYILFTFIIPF